jgi:alanine dehydrogenase
MAGYKFGSELIKKGIDPSLLSVTLEKPYLINKKGAQFRIGIPKEINLHENRIPLTPPAVSTLVANGHEVIIEHNAGLAAQYTDKEYSDCGGLIVYSKKELYSRSDIIVKISPLESQELELVQNRQIIISAVHFGQTQPENIQKLLDKNITAFGFEFLQTHDGSIPFMRTMSEIAGISSIHIASELLASTQSGQGLLLGGITGVPPAQVAILGSGTVGMYACKTAMALGASVRVIDEEVYRLKNLENFLGQKIYTAINQLNYIEEAVTQADVVIGAVHRKGHRTPMIVTEEMIAQMKPGSVVIDVSIDQGGCIETSRLTNHSKPTYVKHDVTHYCVPNIPSRVARTASIAISNILMPLVLKIGEYGSISNLIANDSITRTGIYIYHKHITQKSFAHMLGLDFMDLDLLSAATL